MLGVLSLRRRGSAFAGASLITLSCGGGNASQTGGSDAGPVCKDYVTPDGFTCCCGSTSCTRTPGCNHEHGTGGNASAGGTGGVPATVFDAGVQQLPNPGRSETEGSRGPSRSTRRVLRSRLPVS